MIPQIKLKEEHWKVGDNMGGGPNDPNGFTIGQIAMVNKENGKYDAVFYDIRGKERGRLELVLR